MAVLWELAAADRHSALHAMVDRPDPVALQALLPPRWSEVLDSESFDTASFREWQASLPTWETSELAETPERQSLPALKLAWQRGLRVLVVLPLEGEYRQLGEPGIVLSGHSYRSPVAFTELLNEFSARH
jgi:hypothetical protein